MAAMGRQVESANRVDSEIMSQYGRNQAIMAESLLSANVVIDRQLEGIRREQMSANNRAYSPVAIAPEVDIAPPPPVMQQGPSGLSLLAGIGSAAVSGYKTYDSLKSTCSTTLLIIMDQINYQSYDYDKFDPVKRPDAITCIRQ